MYKTYLLLISVAAVAAMITGCTWWGEVSHEEERAAPDVVARQDAPAEITVIAKRTSPIQIAKTIRSPVRSQPVAVRQPTPTPPQSQPGQTDWGDWILQYREWGYLVLYVIASWIGSWYFGRTGERSDTLDTIQEAAEGRLGRRQRFAAWLIRFLSRKKRSKR